MLARTRTIREGIRENLSLHFVLYVINIIVISITQLQVLPIILNFLNLEQC
jgi:hypothetical protein